jgi:hypothetical protein
MLAIIAFHSIYSLINYQIKNPRVGTSLLPAATI